MGRNLSGGGAVVVPTTSTTTGDSSVIDPRREGLPCVAQWTMYDDQFRHQGCKIINSEFNVVGSAYGMMTYSSPSDYGGGVWKDQEFGRSGDYQGYYRTSSDIGSNSRSTYWIKSLTNYSHAPVSEMLNISPDGMFASMSMNNGWSEWHHTMITQVLPEGVRPRYFIGVNNNNFFRNEQWVREYGERISISDYLSSSRYSTCYGMGGYNERTNTLVIFRSTSNTNRDMVVFKGATGTNLNDPRKTLKSWFESASVSEYEVTFGYSSNDEDRYRGIVTVGDNGYIRVSQMRSGTAAFSSLLTENGEVIETYQHEQGLTTSYGRDQGVYYGVRYQSTWDNDWHFSYCPYYYYGSGLAGHVTSTKDPRVVYSVRQTDSSRSFQIHPIGRSGFILGKDENSDSAKHYMAKLDLSMANRLYNENDRGDYNYWSATTGLPGYGGALSISMQNYLIPVMGYHSTNYPALCTVNWWPTADGVRSYSGDWSKMP